MSRLGLYNVTKTTSLKVKVIVPQEANSTFHNDYMTEEETYKYYNDMMWPKRFATCVSVDEAIKLMEN